MRVPRHVFAAVLLASALVAVVGSRSAAPAEAAAAAAGGTSSSTTLIANGSFEGTLSGWGGYDASLKVVSGGVVGTRSARVTGARRAATYSIYATPKPVGSTTAGSVYTARAAVRSGTSRTLCMRVREWSGSTVAGSAQSCTSAAKAWKWLPSVSYTAAGSNRQLDVYVYSTGRTGGSFDVDGVSLDVTSVEAAEPAPAPIAPPSGLVATSVTTTSVALAWTPSADTRTTGYDVLVAGNVAGTTSGSTYTVSGLACGSPVALAVRAFDSAGTRSASATLDAATAACPPDPAPTPAVACDRHASTSGSDSAAGTASAPYRTVAKLLASLLPGQTGCLAAGQTFTETLGNITQSGRANEPITLSSADPARPATIRGRIVTKPGADYVTFQHLILNAAGAGAPSPTVGSSYVTFRHNEITNDNTSICFNLIDSSTWGTARHTVIDRNRIHHCGRLPATNLDHGIYVSGTDAVITNNLIYDNADRGVQLRGALRAVVKYNVIDGNGEGVIFGDMSASQNEVAYNVITNSKIRWNVESYWGSGTVGTGNELRNNCVWNGADGNIQSPHGFTSADNVTADPLFVDRAAKDFTLRAGSACSAMGPR